MIDMTTKYIVGFSAIMEKAACVDSSKKAVPRVLYRLRNLGRQSVKDGPSWLGVWRNNSLMRGSHHLLDGGLN